ncbi:hypothetical protein K443DRAFT_224738 [Laccaria amethystina LaAM-08-1]|uniref:Uncharacterized protein n=1 Tax=Laccaria amethystina LaAM-08-1 TaxID=1095629 RepID=A0A0C9X997_9AGAR|nr:hypothetical protein K443DRAFT_224738 [Laccaria amethystina LaAM-08-1]
MMITLDDLLPSSLPRLTISRQLGKMYCLRPADRPLFTPSLNPARRQHYEAGKGYRAELCITMAAATFTDLNT